MTLEPLSGIDSAFLSLQGGPVPLQVGAVVVVTPPARPVEGADGATSAPIDRIRRTLEQRTHLVPAIRRRLLSVPLGLAHLVWVDDPDFSLERHLIRVAVPAPGGQAELAALVADRMGRPLDLDHPLWEIAVVEGLAGGRWALAVRAHHAMVDGVAGTELLAALLDLDPTGRSEPVEPSPWTPAPLPAADELAEYALRSCGQWPITALRGVGRVLRAASEVSERNRSRAATDPPPPPSPFRAPRLSCNGAISATRRLALVEVPMARVTEARRAFGGTVHDVVLAAVAGGLRRVLAERGEALPEQFVAMVPASLRTEVDPARPGNQVSGMLVRLPAHPDDPVARLVATSAAAQESKAQAALLEDRVLPGVAEAALPVAVGWLARLSARAHLFDRAAPLANVSVSSLRGPEQALWCAGEPVTTLVPMGPVADGVGLNVTALSHAGTLSVGVLTCGRLLPRPAVLADGVVAEITELAERAALVPAHAHAGRP